MENTFTRRNWLKSAAALGAGLPLSIALAEELMAAPVSRAEKLHGVFRPGKLIRLGSNENPYGPSARAREAIKASITEHNRYSFAESQEFKKVLAEKEGVSPDYILLGAGSGELLALAGMSLGIEGGSVLSAFPTFRTLMEFAVKFNARWDKVDLDETLTHNLEAMAAAVKPDTKIIFVVNPNNPTGTIVEPARLKSFSEEMARKAIVYSDEAYLEFLEPSQQHSMVDLVRKGHNVIVSRTFSKIYGLAGLRLGYLVAKPDILQKFAKYQPGTIINQPVLAAANASLGDTEFMSYTRKKNAEARDYFCKYLDSKKWFYGKSHANVVLFPAPKAGKTILEETEKRGFQIRIWDYQDREWCRVSIGTLDEMKAFTKAFDEVIA
ncbi:MAG: histidinol-phosphate aminotransferase family protein [Flammeovirgaceae bacterium]|nr:MAG: histidinol-phosphate aminotransferase family protein [Flammeovirgaceae bacterium]